MGSSWRLSAWGPIDCTSVWCGALRVAIPGWASGTGLCLAANRHPSCTYCVCVGVTVVDAILWSQTLPPQPGHVHNTLPAWTSYHSH